MISCAGQIPPSGGPPDRIPPTVIRTFPDSNAVRVSTDRIILEFSKYVDRRSVEESIFISPYLGEMEYAWSGEEVTMRFKDKLRPRTTYVVNVGTDVVDLREHNRMASGFTLAFSTGDSIDQGLVRGKVHDDRPEGVMIFAYQLDNIRPDTLDPSRARPDFIMQTGKAGDFTLSNLAMGTYRVFAVRDEYRNLIYDKEVDQIGMTSEDIILAGPRPRVEGVLFRLMREDTTCPFVTTASALTRRRVDLRFSEPLDSSRFSSAVFTITDTLTRRTIPIARAFWKQAQPPTVGIILAAPLDSPATYQVQATNVFDRAGNPLRTIGASTTFNGMLEADTLKPRLTILGMKDSSIAVLTDSSIPLEFSEPVEVAPVEHAVTLLDSLRRKVKYESRWDAPNRFILRPQRPLEPFAWYRLVVAMDSLENLRGGRYHDSTFILRFQTMDLRKTGGIEGKLVDNRNRGKGYVVRAQSVGLTPSYQRRVVLESPGGFAIPLLLEGKYTIFAIEDIDGSGNYNYGAPHPFTPAGRFAMYPDTVKVRARWGVEGVSLEFR